jgi:hypothetical protein
VIVSCFVGSQDDAALREERKKTKKKKNSFFQTQMILALHNSRSVIFKKRNHPQSPFANQMFSDLLPSPRFFFFNKKKN